MENPRESVTVSHTPEAKKIELKASRHAPSSSVRKLLDYAKVE
jgi:hypothetical protein